MAIDERWPVPPFWWENVVKPGIRDLALSREKEKINVQRRKKSGTVQKTGTKRKYNEKTNINAI